MNIIDEMKVMTFYEKFEQIVVLALTFTISIVIVVSLLKLGIEVFDLLAAGVIDPVKPKSFYTVFGMIMTILISLEFKYSILKVAVRKESVIQVKTVMLIALLAISRKFIILDTEKYSAAVILALAAALLSLGIVYWLIRERDDNSACL